MKKHLTTILLFTFGTYGLSASPIRPAKDYALFFAVNQYKHLDNLSNPIADAEKLAQKLKADYEFETEVLKNPTRKQIKSTLEYYRDQFEQGHFESEGQLFIFFTGHGVFEEHSNNGFFIPTDGDPDDLQATAIPYAYWRPFIDRINCKHILVAIDACYSGTFDQKRTMKSADTEGGPVFQRPKELTEIERLIQNHEEHTTRLYLSSSAIEKTPDRSQFTKKLYKALDEGGYRDGLLTAGEIFELYLKSVRPTPIFGEFGQDQAGSNFLFFPKEAKEVVAVSRSEKEEIDLLQTDLDAWKAAQGFNTIGAFDDYVQQFPNGTFVTAARAEMEKLGAEYILSGNRLFDKRDGQTYQTVMINGKMWMAQNLNFAVEGSYCYKDKEANCEQYGRLYTWEAAMKACPKGWHLPTDEEWKVLVEAFSGYTNLGRIQIINDLKKGYRQLIEGGRSGFNALLGGYRYSDGEYLSLDRNGDYWSATESRADNAWYYLFHGDSRRVYRYSNSRSLGFSCRCLKD